MNERAAGILMPISSLPSEYGIGCFSKSAYEFVDWLKDAGQSYWQILPLGPTGYGDSPYQSVSTFAGNPYFIDLEELIDKELLTKEECESCDWGGSEAYVDYEKMYLSRYKLLRKAYERADLKNDPDYAEFLKEEKDWLEDYCLFMAIKNDQKGICWIDWPEELKDRHSKAVKEAGKELGKVLENVTLHPLQIPYVTNVTAEYVEDSAKTKAFLEEQIASSVRWQQSVENMISQGVDTFVEIGPGRTLAGFMRKINRNVKVYNIQTVEDAEKVCQEIG